MGDRVGNNLIERCIIGCLLGGNMVCNRVLLGGNMVIKGGYLLLEWRPLRIFGSMFRILSQTATDHSSGWCEVG